MTADTSTTERPPRTAASPVGWATTRRVAGLTAPLLVAAALVLLTRLFGSFGNAVIITAGITMLVASGLHALVHWTGQVSVAQVAFVGIGAFVTARVNADVGLPLPLAVLAGMAAAVLASLAIGLPALRIRGFALAITTLAFGFAADRWLFVQPWLVPSSAGVPLADFSFLGFDIRDSNAFVVPVILLVVAVSAATRRLGASAIGEASRLVAHDEEVAASYGINVGAHKLFAFLFAGATAGLAGGITVLAIGQAGPAVFPPGHSILYLSAVLLGGRGPVWGSLLAAAALGAVPILLGDLGRIVGLLGPLGILLVVLVEPRGINGQLHAISQLIRRLTHHRTSATDTRVSTEEV
ncbi:MAG: branched-chain amino acid ABC transporter permease [Actinobacteria bacterium]|nr:branched-chain amino acid ABC transporter permease [Actinomycetota bacterium]